MAFEKQRTSPDTPLVVTKVCPLCGIEKPAAEYHTYYSKERQHTRIGNYCKPCARENSKQRAKVYFKENREARLKYAKDYRANPKNREKLRKVKSRFNRLYRQILQPCYLRDVLAQKYGFANEDLHKNPEIVDAYKYQLLIKRTLKKLKNGKK